MNAESIRNELRDGNSEELKRRRRLIALASIGLADFILISLYQTGVIRQLPDLPHPLFNTNQVNASTEAYAMGLPDAPVSAVVYAITIALASTGGSARTGRKPIHDLAMGGMVTANAMGAAYYLYTMIFREKKVCMYCLAGAAINFASAALIAPIMRTRLARLFRRGELV